MNKKWLAMIGDPNNGVEYVRFQQPFEHLADLGHEMVTLGANLTLESGPDGYRPHPSLFEGIDGVIFPQMTQSPELADGARVDLVGAVCDHARVRGLPILYSVDDYPYEIGPDNPAYDRVQSSIESIEILLNYATAIVVTTPSLQEAFAPRRLPVHVLPNAIDPGRWMPRPRTSGERRIGWAGSASHLRDLLMVLPAVARLQERESFRFMVYGLVHRPLKEEAAEVRTILEGLQGPRRDRAELFLELFDRLEEIDYVHIPFTELDAYFEVLPQLDLDLGICPLLDNEFNRHKSALKFYEYAMCETLTLTSAVAPYIDEIALAVPNDTNDWIQKMEAALKLPRETKQELAKQRAFVLEHRNIETIRHDWAAALDAALTCTEPEPATATSGGRRP